MSAFIWSTFTGICIFKGKIARFNLQKSFPARYSTALTPSPGAPKGGRVRRGRGTSLAARKCSDCETPASWTAACPQCNARRTTVATPDLLRTRINAGRTIDWPQLLRSKRVNKQSAQFGVEDRSLVLSIERWADDGLSGSDGGHGVAKWLHSVDLLLSHAAKRHRNKSNRRTSQRAIETHRVEGRLTTVAEQTSCTAMTLRASSLLVPRGKRRCDTECTCNQSAASNNIE